jgi:hypothetical protein
VEAVKKSLDQDVNGAAHYQGTRLPGAPEPGPGVASSPHEAHEFFYELVGESDAAEQAGNLVRAAIQRSRAARVAPAAQAYDTRKQAVALLEALLRRLQPALEISAEELPEWSKHLPELLDKADQGRRPPEAYLLFDLQKVCLDFEREIYALDLVEWLLSGGKKPVQRPLSSQRFVRVTRHVRSAAQRLTMARLSENDRKHFAGLLQAALGRCEDRVRLRFRPLLTSAIEDVGLAPRNPSERTAFQKLTEELLDRILAYGFLTFSDLRDALSRNQLKLPDLADPQDFIRGDPLLRLDRRLATLLDGVYRRGDIYLRMLERFTALNFGTALGRLVTQFVTIPFVGAYLLVQALNHFVLQPLGVEHFPVYVFVPVWGLVGAFLLGLLHSRSVRRWCTDLGRACWRPLKRLAVDVPLWVVRNTALMKVLTSWTFQLFYWYILKPLVLCLLLWVLVPETLGVAEHAGDRWADRITWVQVALTFLAANFLVNSRPGQAAAEAISHGSARFFALLRSGLVPGLIRLVVQVFKHILHTMEAVLFKVDEWLRFRRGDSRLAMIARVVLGVLWFPISYLARFNMVVLIEPCLNPVKFPVCAIATKVMAVMLPVIHRWLMEVFAPMFGQYVTFALATWLVFWLPDVFGFLFWEMKENWSLYQANRGPAPEPVVVGTHGETMRRLLQPGFHSGTIPKLFARLRHAEQKALESGNFTGVRACQAALEEVEEAVRLFVIREFLVLLDQQDGWRAGHPSGVRRQESGGRSQRSEVQLPTSDFRPPTSDSCLLPPASCRNRLNVGRVRLATNQVRVELVHDGFPDQPAWVEFADTGQALTAGLTPAPWLRELPGPEQRALRYSLAVLFGLAGANEVREWAWEDNRNGVLTDRGVAYRLVTARE